MVRVGIAGNQRPVFRGGSSKHMIGRPGPANYYAALPENSAPGTPVIQVTATDPDGPDSQLRYRAAGGEGRDNFVVDEK